MKSKRKSLFFLLLLFTLPVHYALSGNCRQYADPYTYTDYEWDDDDEDKEFPRGVSVQLWGPSGVIAHYTVGYDEIPCRK